MKIENSEKATIKQIRKHYRDLGLEVQVTSDGRVRYRSPTYRKRGSDNWRDGAYIERYIVTKDGNVHLI